MKLVGLGPVEATTDNINERHERIKIHISYKYTDDGSIYDDTLSISRTNAKWLRKALKGALKLTESKED